MQDIRTAVRRMISHFGTQQALADAAGVEQSSVSQWLNGRTKPSLAALMRVERATGGKFVAYKIRPELF